MHKHGVERLDVPDTYIWPIEGPKRRRQRESSMDGGDWVTRG